MITSRLFIIGIVCILFGECYLIAMVRRKKMELRQALLWMLLGLIVILFLACPPLLKGVTRLLGVKTPSNMIFILGFVFVICLLLSLSLSISLYRKQIRTMAQKIALLEHEIKELKTEIQHISKEKE